MAPFYRLACAASITSEVIFPRKGRSLRRTGKSAIIRSTIHQSEGDIMQEQRQAASQLAALHVKGSPLVLYNAWDAGSAKAVAAAGARAIGTSSWALAAAHGYGDGEEIPLALVAQVAGRIAQSAALPVWRRWRPWKQGRAPRWPSRPAPGRRHVILAPSCPPALYETTFRHLPDPALPPERLCAVDVRIRRAAG
jgi:hypothetical protein